MVTWGKQHCCLGRIQDIFLRFRIVLAVLLLHLFLATASKDQNFLGQYKAVFKTACEDPWIMSTRISLRPLKEFIVCVQLKLYSSDSSWTAYVYSQETAHSNLSANTYDLGLTGHDGKLRIWLFGNEINTSERLHENTWNQICIQWKSKDEEMKVFINGEKKANKKLPGKVNLPEKGQFLLGCSKLRGTAVSPNQGMTGELYMFRMWDKANVKQSMYCEDSGVIRWRKEDWVYNKTVEEDNSLPCVETTATLPGREHLTGESAATTISDMTSEETTQTAEALNITDYYSTITPAGETILCNITPVCNYSVFYVGTVRLQVTEESNTSLNVEIINNTAINKQVTKLLAISAPSPQELRVSEFNKTLQALSESSVMKCSTENQSVYCNFIMKLADRENVSSLRDKTEIIKLERCCCSSLKYCSLTAEELRMYTIQVPPHTIWVPFPHFPSLPKKTYPQSNTFTSPTTLSTKQSPTSTPLMSPFTDIYSPETVSTSHTTVPLSETSATSTTETSVSSTSATSTLSSSESLAQPAISTFPSNKSVTASTTATKSATNAAFSIKSDAAYFSKPITIISPSVDLSKHSTVSSSELPPKPSIAIPPMETTTKSIAQNHLATESTQPISGNKKITTAPLQHLPLTPFPTTLTPTVGPINHSVSASHPHASAAVHGSIIHGSTGKILSTTTYTTYVHTTTSMITAEQIVSKIENDLAAGKVEPKDVERMVSEVSKVLTASQPLPPRISNRIIKLVDYIGLKLNFPATSADFASPSLALAVVKTNSIRSNQMSFAVKDSADLQVFLNARSDFDNLGSITLPSSLLINLSPEELNMASRIIFNFFKKTTVFQDLSLKNASLISNVISSSVANLTIRNLKTNVTITLQTVRPNQDNSTVTCVFWDFSRNDGHGGWSSEGCIVKESRVNETVCSCNHLTSFAVLTNMYGDTPWDPTQELALTFISYIGCGLSAVFLSVTLVTYLAFEKIRRDIPSKILIQLCTALLLLNLVFLLDSWITLYQSRILCITVAACLHYFLLAAFTWMGLEAFHMYLALVKVFNTYVQRYMLKFCIVGWGLPAVVVSTVLAVSTENYGLLTTGKVSLAFCWIKNKTVFYIAAVGYFCVIFLVNTGMFIVVLIQLYRIKKKKQLGSQRKNSIQELRSVTGLTFLLGITWGFAFLQVSVVFSYLFTIFNSLQGFFIFLFYCATKENVRKQWKRFLCCGKFRLAENSDWSRTPANRLRKQTVNQGVFNSSHSLQSTSNSTISTTLLMNSDYSLHVNGNGYLSSEKNGVSFIKHNGDVCLHDFSGKKLVLQEKDDTGSQKNHISLQRRTPKKGKLNLVEKM